ncbi:KH domain-containing protein [Candidatus Electronema sp. JM]|uniref:KH domain-containing protein n=1 Tax=Candidatus Electronema sp. JM TaxID=3401571 RepID=UPI003AA7E040
MKDLVSFIAAKLVDAPEQVETSQREEGDAVTVELKVAKEDLGKIIGKQGRTARSIRTVLAAAAEKRQKRCRIEILE